MHLIPSWNSYPFSGLIPELYYNVNSPEQRIKNLCKNIQKLIEYCSETATTVNEQYDVITTLLENLPETVDESVKKEVRRLIDDGELEPILEEAVSEWLEQRTAQIDEIEENLENEIDTRSLEIASLSTLIEAEAEARAAGIAEEASARDDAIEELANSLGDAASYGVENVVIDGSDDLVTSDGIHDAIASRRAIVKNKVIVCIGDSLTSAVGATNAWPFYLASMCGCEIHNYAEGGTGFVNKNEQNQNFTNQLAAAVSDTDVDNDTVTDVIIMGGYNDYAYVSQVADAATTLVEDAREAFQNADVHVGVCLHGIYPLDYALGGATENQKRSLLISPIEWGVRRGGGCIIPESWTWAIGETGMKYDNIHVNDNGQMHFAQMILAYLQNGNASLFKQEYCETVESSISSSNLRCFAQNGTVHLQGQFTTTSEIVVGATLFNLPGWAWRSNESNDFNLTSASWHDWHPIDNEGSRIAVRGEVVTSRYIGIGTTAVNCSWPMGI